MARTRENHLDPAQGPKRILALDGGGVKGILTLGMLKEVELELRRRARDPNLVLSDYYDLIGGTSTGAIISSGLALGKSCDEMIELYMKLGPDVFGKSQSQGIFKSKFDAKKLRKALDGVLGKRTLGTADLRTGFAICAKRIDTGSAWVLSNHPAAKYYDTEPDSGIYPNKKYRLADIVQASAAAPTFFDEVKIQITYPDPDRPKEQPDYGYFVDGAVGANNNPSQQLLLLALVQEYGFRWQAGPNLLMMTSLGTGLRRPRIEGQSFKGLPPGMRGIHALRAMIYDTQLQGVMLMQGLSDSPKPWIVNSEVKGMEQSLISSAVLLDYQRMDVRLEVASGTGEERAKMMFAEDLAGEAFDAAALDAMDQLANGRPANMERLLDLGRAAGKVYVGETYPNPAFDLPEWAKAEVAA